MKYLFFGLGLFLIAGCAHTATTPAPVDIVGLWMGEYNSPMGGPPMRFAFSFTGDGESMGGAMRNETLQGGWEQLENLKIKGNKISFAYAPQIYQGKITFRYRGKIAGDKIKLAYKVTRGPGTGHFPQRESSFINREGSQIRSGKVMSKGSYSGDAGMDSNSAYSQEFTIVKVQ